VRKGHVSWESCWWSYANYGRSHNCKTMTTGNKCATTLKTSQVIVIVYNRVIRKVTLSSPCLHPVCGPPFTPYPLFQRYLQSKDILINLSMKCWYSTFNAQGSRLIIVVVQLGAVKIYVAAVEALRKKKRQDETQFTTKNWWFSEFHPPLNAHVLFCSLKKNLTLCVWPNSGLWCCFFLSLRITLIP
jgi:hypothetical protein